MPSRVGAMRPGYELQRDVGTAETDAGDPVPDWETVARLPAAVEPLVGRELERARQVQPDATHRVRFRFGPRTWGAGAGWRLRTFDKHRGRERLFHFAEPPRDVGERHRYLEVLATEREPQTNG